jgi:hypothetical protein
MLGDVFERCVEQRPLSGGVRGPLERIWGPAPLDVWDERTATKLYARARLFSIGYDRMRQDVCRLRPSVHAIGGTRRRSGCRGRG